MADATRARYKLLRFTFALSIITYVDRVCISTAAGSITSELHLTPAQMGWVFSAFTIAYALFEIPSGRLGDTLGPRKVLTRIVLWWSAFTMATGLVWSYLTLLIARFLFGAGEAGAFPNMSRSLSHWFPERERGTAHGVMFMGSRLGGAITPLLVTPILAYAGWRTSFWIFGLLGVVWSIFWWRWFRDDPSSHPEVNAGELAVIQESALESGTAKQQRETPLWSLFKLQLLWISLMYFCYGYSLYFYLTWLPTYLRDVRGFSNSQTSLVHTFVLLTAAAASILGGRLTDLLVKRYGLRIGRSIGVVALPVSGIAMAAAALTTNNIASAVLLAAAAGAGDLCLSTCWAICHDVGKDDAGTVTGCMNTFANIGGALSPLVLGYTVQWWGSWATPLLIAAGVSVLGGLLTLPINASKPLRESS
jgi:MFS transporter, ACS family, glucarate transporter